MSKNKIYSIALVLSFGCFGTHTGFTSEFRQPRIATVQLNNQFGFSLFRTIAKSEMTKDVNQNIFVSPISAALTMQMLLNGAGERSNTYKEISKTLGVDRLDLAAINQSNQTLLSQIQTDQSQNEVTSTPFTLSISNSVWSNLKSAFNFNADFVNTLKSSYRAEAKIIDFTLPLGATAINHWATQKTNGKITTIIDSETLAPLFFVMLNATYFKANWNDPFDPFFTSTNNYFTQADGTRIAVDMMSKKRSRGYIETSSAQTMELPYFGNRVSMFVILPKEGQTTLDALTDPNGVLSGRFWTELDQGEKGYADFYLPKFSFSYEIQMNEHLKALGMNTVFTDLSDLSQLGSPSSKVSLVKQNTFIKLDEQGTEAAAVTTIGMVGTSFDGPILAPIMRVNRPFFISIVEKTTGSVLFLGVISSPESH